MKKITFLILFTSSLLCLYGQNRKIEFQTGEWKDMLTIAKKSGKKIFLDCYTSWCGPCKVLERDVFTCDPVADFFNLHFINVKIDMEEEGAPLTKKYTVHSYPTLLFIDPETEEAIHRIVGSGSAEWLLTEARKTLEGQNHLAGLRKRYNVKKQAIENIPPSLIAAYLNALEKAGNIVEKEQVMDEYFQMLSDEEWATPEHWGILDTHLSAQSNPYSYTFRRFLSLYSLFYSIAESQQVNFRIGVVVKNNMNRYLRWSPESGNPFDRNGHRRLSEFLKTIDYPLADYWQACMETAGYWGSADYRNMLKSMQSTLADLNLSSQDTFYYLALFLRHFALAEDPALLHEVIEWLEQLEKTLPGNSIPPSAKEKIEAQLQSLSIAENQRKIS